MSSYPSGNWISNSSSCSRDSMMNSASSIHYTVNLRNILLFGYPFAAPACFNLLARFCIFIAFLCNFPSVCRGNAFVQNKLDAPISHLLSKRLLITTQVEDLSLNHVHKTTLHRKALQDGAERPWNYFGVKFLRHPSKSCARIKVRKETENESKNA